jgi:hypothetical protein
LSVYALALTCFYLFKRRRIAWMVYVLYLGFAFLLCLFPTSFVSKVCASAFSFSLFFIWLDILYLVKMEPYAFHPVFF